MVKIGAEVPKLSPK